MFMITIKGCEKMEDLFISFMEHIKNEDKESAFNLCINALKSKKISVVDLYQTLLTPALNSVVLEYKDDEDLIWREHVRSGIIRNIIECSYPYVLMEKNYYGEDNHGNVIVMCPPFEEHELGARMISDFFTIAGYKSTFIGANTPEKTIIKAIEIVDPKYLCISITNYYNLVSVKKIINMIKESANKDIKFILGGSAFLSNPGSYKEVGGDYLLNSFHDILKLRKGAEKN